ncbi:MAG TPA: ABC transporter ATP-binding protein [Chthonomonadaceae bacterium]|nr:ABC transporter ATP-binding protein [Chthonomonadaceae bacterium]
MPEPASVPEVAAPADALIRMEHITRRFPGVLANADVHLRVRPGAFHALIGENGAGKSTLLNILYGRLRPDNGQIFLAGKEITGALQSPADAIRLGLGLVSQHYALIPALSVLENIVLGAEPAAAGGWLDRRRAARRIGDLAARLGLGELDLGARAERLSVAAQQKVEILKALYRGARILLLDEPTATLAPQEADSLFALLHALAQEGATILFVTHKLREVMAHSDAVTVLRAGRNAGDFLTRETDAQTLLTRMIGASGQGPVNLSADPLSESRIGTEVTDHTDKTGRSSSLRLPKTEIGTEAHAEHGPESVSSSASVIQIEAVTVRNDRRAVAVRGVSLEVGAGEIVGVAGVDGNGQRELAEAIVGLRRVEAGRIALEGVDLTRRSVGQRRQRGMAYIPEDRHRTGLILDFTIAENFLLGHERQPEWGGGVVLEPRTLRARAADMIVHYSVRVGPQEALTPARALSGGNQQKVVVARAMEGDPRLLVACQPTRGLDVEASRFVYRVLQEARARGLGVLLFSLDLDEALQLSDRIAVLFNGRLAGMLARGEATPERVGALMTGAGAVS